MFESIYQVILKAIISVEDQVNAAINRSVRSRNCCFNLLGFDILLDSNLRPWLLEINGSPSLSYDSPLDYFVKGEVVADILTMVRCFAQPPRTRCTISTHRLFLIRHFCTNCRRHCVPHQCRSSQINRKARHSVSSKVAVW